MPIGWRFWIGLSEGDPVWTPGPFGKQRNSTPRAALQRLGHPAMAGGVRVHGYAKGSDRSLRCRRFRGHGRDLGSAPFRNSGNCGRARPVPAWSGPDGRGLPDRGPFVVVCREQAHRLCAAVAAAGRCDTGGQPPGCRGRTPRLTGTGQSARNIAWSGRHRARNNRSRVRIGVAMLHAGGLAGSDRTTE